MSPPRAAANRVKPTEPKRVGGTAKVMQNHKSHKVAPGPTLKALRNRANVSSAVCAKALGLKGPSGYARYENDEPYVSGGPIPYKVIEAIRPYLVGRGMPPVTDEELWAICEIKGLKGLLPKVTEMVASEPKPPSFTSSYNPNAVANTLETRYRAELGVFSTLGSEQRRFAAAPILPCATFPQGAQFAVSVGDDHAKEFGIRAGAFVHCIDPNIRAVMIGSVVLAARRMENFHEIVFARVVGGNGTNGWQLELQGTDGFKGAVLAVAHKAYTPIF